MSKEVGERPSFLINVNIMIQKTQGKFYPLQDHEWVRTDQEFTPSQFEEVQP